MKLRTKIFLGALLMACAAAAVVAKEPRLLLYCLTLYGAMWCIWKLFQIVYVFLTPIRNKLRPVNTHLESSLRSVNLNPIADLHEGMTKKINESVLEKR